MLNFVSNELTPITGGGWHDTQQLTMIDSEWAKAFSIYRWDVVGVLSIEGDVFKCRGPQFQGERPLVYSFSCSSLLVSKIMANKVPYAL